MVSARDSPRGLSLSRFSCPSCCLSQNPDPPHIIGCLTSPSPLLSTAISHGCLTCCWADLKLKQAHVCRLCHPEMRPPRLRVLAVVLLRCCRAAGWIQISSSCPRGAREAGVYMSLSYCPSRHPDSPPTPK